jgi:hypothetical protein
MQDIQACGGVFLDRFNRATIVHMRLISIKQDSDVWDVLFQEVPEPHAIPFLCSEGPKCVCTKADNSNKAAQNNINIVLSLQDLEKKSL